MDRTATSPHRPRVARWPLALPVLTCAGVWCGAFDAVAQSESSIAATVQDAVSSAIPRTEGPTVTPELSASVTRLAPVAVAPIGPDGRPMSDLAGVSYRLWTSHGRTDLGVGVGTIGYVQPRPDGRIEGPVSLTGAVPTVSLGLRYHVTRDSAVYADASGARGLGTDTANGYVNAKVGLEWKPAKSRFGFEHGALGMHLDSGYGLALKARHGGLGLYLRGQF
jgi:hypothetical protein